MKKISDFLWLSSLPNFGLNFAFLTSCLRQNSSLLWVWFHIHHQENANSLTMPTHWVAAACSNTHHDGVTLFRFLGDPCLREKCTKQVHCTRAQWNPMENSVLYSKHFEEDCFEPGTDVRAGCRCKIRMESYASKYTSQSLFDKRFLRIQCT